jgi:hypothetical protein
MMENFITVRVYLNINDDPNKELFRQVFIPANQTLNTSVSPTSVEHGIKIEGNE